MSWIRSSIRRGADALWARLRGISLRTGTRIALAGGLVFVVLIIHHELISVVRNQNRYAIDPDAGPVVTKPDWADDTGAETHPGSVVGDIRTTLDDELVQRIGRAMDENPWIRRVLAVDRVYPGQVRVRFEYREPHLAVRTSRGIVLVDQDLVRLPGRYTQAPVPMDRAEIRGVTSNPPPAGQRWKCASLFAGQSMADLCAVNPTLSGLGVEWVDVSDREGRVRLHLANGCEIHWGRAACAADYSEPPLEGKLYNLRRVLVRNPSLDGLASVYVFGKDPTVVPRDGSSARGR